MRWLKHLIKKLERNEPSPLLFPDIRLGFCYVSRDPFARERYGHVQVLDLKDGYVKYRFQWGGETSLDVQSFMQCYKPR